jgi:hypothetical protein
LWVARVRHIVCMIFLFYNRNGYPEVAADVVLLTRTLHIC